jgi:hypothetical protein
MVQNPDHTLLQQFTVATRPQRARGSYRVEIPAAALDEQCRQIERVIQFALDILGAHHLDVRVVSIEQGTEA